MKKNILIVAISLGLALNQASHLSAMKESAQEKDSLKRKRSEFEQTFLRAEKIETNIIKKRKNYDIKNYDIKRLSKLFKILCKVKKTIEDAYKNHGITQ